MSFAAGAIIELCARLRLVCSAMGIEPDDVHLDDLAADVASELRDEGTRDFWMIVNAANAPKAIVRAPRLKSRKHA